LPTECRFGHPRVAAFAAGALSPRRSWEEGGE